MRHYNFALLILFVVPNQSLSQTSASGVPTIDCTYTINKPVVSDGGLSYYALEAEYNVKVTPIGDAGECHTAISRDSSVTPNPKEDNDSTLPAATIRQYIKEAVYPLTEIIRLNSGRIESCTYTVPNADGKLIQIKCSAD